MTELELQELIGHHPVLYHMAAQHSWPSIRCRGLLSTSALLDLYEIGGGERERIETAHRPKSVEIRHPTLGRAFVRDQKPMSDSRLRIALEDGLTPMDWYRILNQRTFFWLTLRRLKTFLCARSYAQDWHDVLIVETTALLNAYRDRIVLSPMNSGCTVPIAHPRGLRTFLRIDDYPYGERKRKRLEPVVELAVDHGIADIERFVLRVDSMSCNGEPRAIWSP